MEPCANNQDMDAESAQFLLRAIEVHRDKLIDISKRNPLIAFKHSERSARFVRVIADLPDNIHRVLRDGEMTFRPLPPLDEPPADEREPAFCMALAAARLSDPEYLEDIAALGESERDEEKAERAERALRNRVRASLGMPAFAGGKHPSLTDHARAHGIDPSFELPKALEAGPYPPGNELRVLHVRDRLDARLRTIHDKYRSYDAETGVHTLYVAFGFLEWAEDEAAAVRHHAPILLMQVHLARSLERGRYVHRLFGTDADLEPNIALRELLRRRFGLELPPIEDEETPDGYFGKVEVLVASTRHLQVRRFVTVGIFPFPRMALWADLDPGRWPGQSLLAHRELAVLLGAKDSGAGNAVFPPDYAIEDEALAEQLPQLILPADVSQHSALVDVANGKSLAVQGPPGTGKSQTIANLLAVALKQGKRVLFVAEKRAALDVVSKRLVDRGLGPLLFELHSERATKSEVIQSLRERQTAVARFSPAALAEARSKLERQRATLRRYVSLLRCEVGRLGRPVNALYWRYLSLQEKLSTSMPAALKVSVVERPETVAAVDLTWKRQALDALEAAVGEVDAAYGDGRECWWRSATTLPITPFKQDELLDQLGLIIRELDQLISFCDAFQSAFGLAFPQVEREAEAWAAALTQLPERAAHVCQLRLSTALSDRTAVEDLLGKLREYRMLLAQARTVHPSPLAVEEMVVERAEQALLAAGLSSASLDDLHTHLAADEAKAAAYRQVFLCLAAVCTSCGLDASLLEGHRLRVLLAAFRRVSELPDEVLLYRSANLLAADASLLLQKAIETAGDLRAREAELDGLVDVNACSRLNADELDRLAASLESTGVPGRLFSSRYKAGLQQARTLSTGAVSHRLELASLLRRTAGWLRDAGALAEDASVSRLFPAGWAGYRSDFASLMRAHDLLHGLSGLLLTADLDVCLLFIASADLSALRAAASALLYDDRLFEAVGAIGASIALGEALARADDDVGRIQAAIAAFEAADFNWQGVVQATGQSTAATFRRLSAVSAEIEPGATSAWPWHTGSQEDEGQLEAVIGIGRLVQRAALPEELTGVLAAHAEPGRLIEQLLAAGCKGRDLIRRYQAAWQAFATSTGVDVRVVPHREGFEPLPWAAYRPILAEAHADRAGLRLAAKLLMSVADAKDQGVNDIYLTYVSAGCPVRDLADAYELILVKSLLTKFLSTEGEALERMQGWNLEQARRDFRALDDEAMALEAQSILATRLNDQPPAGIGHGRISGWTDFALIRNEMGKQKRHIPVRNLVGRATKALQALKPVWLMSPMSVAQYIPPGSASFDLVVIDEASQMRPEFAIGSIARAARVVVVGDPKQLPPSDFFTVKDESLDEEDQSDIMDSESILDCALARLSDVRRLRWHYRSQHASLIALSNRLFYDRELVVFPNAVTDDPLLGLKYKPVDGGAYAGRINRPEAQEVVQTAVGLIYAHRDLSMGIVTMNADQRDLIFAEFETIAMSDPTVRSYVETHGKSIEPFFVKNLENVQGDERDIIIVSTLYGPSPDTGRVAQRFGPIASSNGHRRLNVLFTRAKMTTIVVTSLRPADIVVGAEASEGVRAFRAYLEFAAGGAVVDSPDGGEPDSDFEMFVADRLRHAGYEVVPQVGVERFRIDLGVRHPTYPLGFLAGIECDGATYHSSLTVRDRDRIRQDILEGLGWRIYRVWSTDWFNDSEKETVRLLRWLEDIREREAARYEAKRAAMAACEAEDVRTAPGRGSNGARTGEAAPAPRRPVPTGNRETRRPKATQSVVGQPDLLRPVPPPSPAPVTRPLPLVPRARADTPSTPRAERPEGRRRTIDGIDYYEVQPGYYEVWVGNRKAGEVQRLSRTPVLAARLYGNRVVAPITHYQVSVAGTDEVFNVDDIYEAVRKLAVKLIES